MNRADRIPSVWLVRYWPAVVLLLLLPIWCVGILGRDAWTPDEPREANIIWHMGMQENRALPEFAGAAFAEKPPLSYWVAAASRAILGDSVRASRAPNLLFATLTILSIGALAAAMAGREAALVASLVAGTTLLMLRVNIWLAPDACLIAACALGLLGAYRGYITPHRLPKLAWYALLHVGAALAFMAKNISGGIIPFLALGALIAWERNWREMLRVELYAGLLLLAAIIGPWLLEVLARPDGSVMLHTLLVENSAGRFMADGSYATGHRNWPGRYLVELPFSFLPWTFCLIASGRAAWVRSRRGPGLNTAWRFCIASSIPFLALLCVASTARDIYAAPSLIGLSAWVALWLIDGKQKFTAGDRFALQATRVVVLVIVAALATSMLLFAMAGEGDALWLTSMAAIVAIAAVIALCIARNFDNTAHHTEAIVSICAALSVALTLAALMMFPAINRWKDLPALTRSIRLDTRGTVLATLRPDETTRAMLDHGQSEPPLTLDVPAGSEVPAVRRWFCEDPEHRRLLVKLPAHARGQLSWILDRVLHPKPLPDGIAATLAAANAARIVARYELPHGRRYALLGPPDDSDFCNVR